jgi:cystathionine gamma-synthase
MHMIIYIMSIYLQAFFDALDTHKGPSLGTNFTLACPYTLLAHYR